MRLYDLTEQYTDLRDLLEQDADNEALQAMLDGIGGKIEDKIDNVLAIRNEKRANAKMCREEAQRLLARAAQEENQANRLEIMVEYTMRRTGVDNVKTNRFTAWLQNNPPSVEIVNQVEIPEKYWKPVDAVLDKKAIKEAIDAGESVPGVTLKQSESLRVR
jgi:hypothetical protein